ncbi:16S rRNA (uracil(1498)-N(3))-methyltransferase [Synechococcus sp. RSCCF101]|uniref:RsmE family RNA methyltransferase n=1 Tax=Synechococcus sp. RSCCF101 TaxID=2511069 RepID=UPI001244E51E|nr:16S rRNA (uracil(1498)-N(3))-methyltransferase [Synechococcus sp. RSCCF101]QEY31840.1 16S rRNA (uracil(1498)-N(3))-methyltransferase [Synechococcus sp. RSCCF101]
MPDGRGRRERRRLLIAPDRLHAGGGVVTLLERERHYLRKVLRLRSGERCDVVDGAGHLWSARLAADETLALEPSLSEPRRTGTPPRPGLELALAVPRRSFDEGLRMVVELGLDRLTLLRAERSVAAPGAISDRWRLIVAEACEQCERLWCPALEGIEPACGVFETPPAAGELRLLATTRRRLDGLMDVLRRRSGDGLVRVVLAVGPEGGWSPAEEARAEGAGWLPVSLSDQILRTPTAAVAAVAQLATWRDGLSSPCPAPSPSP